MNCSTNTRIYFDIDYPGEPAMYKTLHAVDYVKIVFIALIIAGTLVGNFCVIVVIGSNKTMRTVINIYIGNLALADLLVCSICMTSFFWKTLLNNHIFILGPVMCKLIHFCQVTALTCSVLTLSAIACDRANAVLFPLRTLITKKRTKLVITAIWLISSSVSIPLLFVRTLYTLHFKNFIQENCGDRWPFDEFCNELSWVPVLYYTFLSVILFFLPVTIMAVTYSLILWRLAKAPPGEVNEARLTTQNRTRKKIIKMVFTVLIVFVICWMPLQIVLLYDKYRSKVEKAALPFWYENVARVAEFLAFSNSFLNPIIYGGFSEDFRNNVRRFLKCSHRHRRRFGSSGFIRRFRTTLTTALSSSLRTANTVHERREPAANYQMQSFPIAVNGTAASGGIEENHVQEAKRQEKNAAV